MPQPNFIFIMTDTQGANMLGVDGRPELQTPCLDRLAAQGVRFPRAYTTCPVCTPARGAIFTGLYPHFNGAWANSLPLYDTMKTMGQRFRDAGYRTAFSGKWHLGGLDYFDTGICPDGWDEEYWYDGKRYLAELTPEEVQLWRTGLQSAEKLREHQITPEFTWGHRISDRGIRFLQEAHSEPFVLVLSYDEPHGPETCPAEYVERFRDYQWQVGPNAFDDLADKPDFHRRIVDPKLRTNPTATGCYPLYFGCNSFVDTEIGRVLEAVDRYAPENTYVIFTSDHGSMLGAHRLHGKGLVMYEETTRIPFIIRQPGCANAGKVDQTLASHVDLLPTMLELAGLEVPPILDGTSLVPNLQGDHSDPDKAVFLEWHRGEIDHDGAVGFFLSRTIRRGDWKMVVNQSSTDEVYNVTEDPHELHNRILDPACAQVRETLFDQLINWMSEVRDPFRGKAWMTRHWHGQDHDPSKYDWRAHRGRPADGYLPDYVHYDTCQPVAPRQKAPVESL